MKSTLDRKLFLVFKIGLGTVLSMAALDAYAEYYMVYPAAAPVSYTSGCSECGRCYYRHNECNRCYRRYECPRCYQYECRRCYRSNPCHDYYYESSRVHYIYSSAPYRGYYSELGSGEISQYAWIPTPEAP